MIPKGSERSESPCWWDFTPKGKSDTFRMINLGGGVSLSESKCRKIFERYSRAGEDPGEQQPLMRILYYAYHRMYAGG